MAEEAEDDEELMTRWQAGDTGAFDTLVGRHGSSIFGFLLSLLGDRALAEDAYSETLFRLVRFRDRYDPARPFRGWLFAVARNCARDVQRLGGRLKALVVRVVELRGPSIRARSAEDALIDDERAERIAAALAGLPEEHRAIVLLSYREGLNGREVADALGISHRQARDKLAYARKRLRALLADERSEP